MLLYVLLNSSNSLCYFYLFLPGSTFLDKVCWLCEWSTGQAIINQLLLHSLCRLQNWYLCIGFTTVSCSENNLSCASLAKVDSASPASWDVTRLGIFAPGNLATWNLKLDISVQDSILNTLQSHTVIFSHYSLYQFIMFWFLSVLDTLAVISTLLLALTQKTSSGIESVSVTSMSHRSIVNSTVHLIITPAWY